MNYNKCSNDLTENEVNHQTFLSYKQLTPSKIKTESNVWSRCSFKTKKNEQKVIPEQNFISDVKQSSTTSMNSKVSIHSDVKSSDEEILPSSTKIPDFNSFETNTTANHYNKQFHKSKNCRDNNVNKNEAHNCKIAFNNNKYYIINNNNKDHIISENFDKKFKVEESRIEGKVTRYQHQIKNAIESKNIINFSQQRNLETLTSTETLTPTTKAISIKSKQDIDELSLQHNEFIHPQQQPFPTTSSISMSTKANHYEINLFSNMHPCKGSPVVSIRSINSTTITSDSDSGSDLSSDAENYVIKKLGDHVDYSSYDPAIPNKHKSQTVINRKVIANSNQKQLQPLEAFASFGDSFGTAQALGPASKISNVTQPPQIGSIALSNSNDVNFGDKHFYEGPVTIQQFLVDNCDNAKKNPTFTNENEELSTNNAKDINSDAEKSHIIYKYILKRKKLITSGVLTFTALLIMVTIWGSRMLNESKSKLVHISNEESRNIIPINSTIDKAHSIDSSENGECKNNGTLCFINRDAWCGHPQKGTLDTQKLPLHRVVISHTASEPCNSIKICVDRVRVIQEFHMNSFGWDDIGYNFLVSSDGYVYIGRGWDYVGAHTKGYNYDSVGISFIGTYISIEPTEVQLNACISLLEEGLRLKKLVPDYRLYGARQFGATESPGEMLYNRIKKWKHWSAT